MKSNLGNTLFGQARRQILSLLYGHTDRAYYLREIIRITGIGIGPAQRELKNLTDSGIVTREIQGKQVYYQANPKCPIFDELKAIVRKTFGIADVIRESFIPFKGIIKAAFIFGSVAKNTDDRKSDIDLMVIGDISFGDVVSAVSPAEEKLRREINSIVYPPEEFRKKVKEDHHFVKNVIGNDKIFIIGDEDELARLAG